MKVVTFFYKILGRGNYY